MNPVYISLFIIFSLVTLGGLLGYVYYLTKQRLKTKEHNEELKNQLEDTKKLLSNLISLNRQLIDADDENRFLEQALRLVSDVVNAKACTFVPVDELGQPLPPYVFGEIPKNVLQSWSEHLVEESIQQKCRTCQVLSATASSTCPLANPPFSKAYDLYCLPLNKGDRRIGVLNVYLLRGEKISKETNELLISLLSEIGIALETIRLRKQEIATLKQLQLLKTKKLDLENYFSGLLDGLVRSLDLDWAGLFVQDSTSNEKPPFILDYSTLDSIPRELFINFLRDINWTDEPLNLTMFDSVEEQYSLLLEPIKISENKSIGGLIILRDSKNPLVERHTSILQTAAVQAGQLIDIHNKINQMEYNAIMQERTRLAREVHDGLAQTLAYLKLQTAQMNKLVNRKDIIRLGEYIKQNYQTISDAYLEVRQVIDNLRKTSDERLSVWMEELILDFEKQSGLRVVRSLSDINSDLSEDFKAQIIRIVQEALGNIRKHSRANQVRVSLQDLEHDIIIEIADDGIGFCPEDVPDVARYGLRGMRERAELIGADFQVMSDRGKGAKVILRLPKLEGAHI